MPRFRPPSSLDLDRGEPLPDKVKPACWLDEGEQSPDTGWQSAAGHFFLPIRHRACAKSCTTLPWRRTIPALTEHDLAIIDIVNAAAGKQIGKSIGEIGDDENLFDLGLTSVGFISIIIDLEERFDILFTDEELDLANFNSLARIKAEVRRKLTPAAEIQPGCVAR
jgi:acyl carrier protein